MPATITTDHLDALFDAQCNATDADFRKIFGAVGDHLWLQFQQLDYDLVRMYGRMDRRNGQILLDWLNSALV